GFAAKRSRVPGSTERALRSGQALRSPESLECLFRLPHIAGAILEAGEFFQEGEGNFADGTISLFGDDQFGLPRFFGAGLFVFLINFWPNEQSDQIGILFDRTGLAQIAQAWFAASRRLVLALQLRDND